MLASITGSFVGCLLKTDNTQQQAMNSTQTPNLTSPIVDTAQGFCYNNSEAIICPKQNQEFYGQDAQYTGNVPSYKNNGNNTITDNVTGLVWTQNLSPYSMDWSEASGYCASLQTGNINNWRLPNIKELWSIRDFSAGWPWVNTHYFYLVGNGKEGAQQHSWSSNYYEVNTSLAKKQVAFVVNDWTGHIKALDGKRFVRCVAGKEYGNNDYVDNHNDTITDKSTGLMWAKNDSGKGMNWKDALSYAENATYAGYDDWRLPNAKELQSIVDYSGVFPAINSNIFNISKITNEAGNADYPYFWTSTTTPYIDPNDAHGYWFAWYVAFGYAVDHEGQDMHGAGAVRFDTKSELGADGPDGERYYNYVRLVRGGNVISTPKGDPTPPNPNRVVKFKDGDTGNIGNRPGGSGEHGEQHKRPDIKGAANQLGVTEETLMKALGKPNQGPPNLETTAQKLGRTVDQLKAALMTSDNPKK
ncbi:hypothetical protein JCM30760_24610 [Thiomicrorhabdus hydrogeniphila]